MADVLYTLARDEQDNLVAALLPATGSATLAARGWTWWRSTPQRQSS